MFILIVSLKWNEYKEIKETSIECAVIDYKKEETYQRIICRYQYYKILLYDYDNINVQYGDVITVEIKKYEMKEVSFLGDFNYKNYLKSINIKGCYIASKIIVKKSQLNIRQILPPLNALIDSHYSSKTSSYIKILFLGFNTFDEETFQLYQATSLTHLLSISGMHIILYVKILKGLFNFLKMKKNAILIVLTIILFLYMYLLHFNYGVVRAIFMMLIPGYLKICKKRFTKLDIISVLFIISVLYNPYVLYNLGFIFTYAFTLLLCLLRSKKNTYFANLTITIYLYIGLYPFICNSSKDIYLLVIFLMPFISNIFSLIIYLLLLIIIIPKLDHLVNLFIIFYESFIKQILEIPIYYSIPYASITKGLIYYVILFLIIYYLKGFKKTATLILLTIYSCRFTMNKIEFISCGQGDSAVCFIAGEVIVVDAYNKTTDYIKAQGIKEIDKLILTHGHDDHIGGAKDLIENFKISEIYYPANDGTTQLKEVIGYAKNRKIKTLQISDLQLIKIKDISLYFLNSNITYKNENDNSLVFLLEYKKNSILFTGDIEGDAEENIMNTISCDIDILKVAHHGSSTSTSESFIDWCKPEVGIISCGKNNRYGFPTTKTLETLSEIKIYRTDLLGNITIFLRNNNYFIKTYRNM